ncbi:hypothetical protein AAC387_Pa02g2556 [Persea americana]
MPQDNIKSAVYRSLKKSGHVPYGESNETDTHGTNRKSKTSSPMAKTIIIEKKMTDKDPVPSLRGKEEKAKASTGISELDSIHSSQLWQVSEGAQNLNQMVDLWPEGPSLGKRSSHFANDLLRGASDLQESLIMLGKLQEDSIVMARRKKKQKPNIRKEKEIDVEKVWSDRFQNGNYQNICQAPRVSVDGSSKSHMEEELKKVIRDRLYRQNLLSVPSGEEKNSSDGQNLNSLSDGLLESSRRLNTVPLNDRRKNMCYDQKPSVGNSNPATSLHKPKRPNLIAKLMGLEDLPSEKVQTTTKQMESKRFLSPHHPNFNIDMPKTRKLQFKNPDTDQERKTLKEILDTMQFKGLLKSNYYNDYEIESRQMKRHSRDFSKVRPGEILPPIVIIKPLPFPFMNREDVKPEELIWPGISDPKQIHKKLGGRDQKNLETVVEDSIVLDSRIVGKTEAKEQQIKETIVYEDGASDTKQIFRKLGMSEQKIVETADESSNKIKAAVEKQKKKEAIKASKKVEEVQKALPDRKPVKENTKSVIASRSQVRTTSTKSNQPKKVSIPVKNHSSCQRSAAQNQNSTSSKQSMTRAAKNQTRKEKQYRESPAMNSVTVRARSEDDGAVSALEISDTARTLLDDRLPIQIKQDMKIKDSAQENQNSASNIVPDPAPSRVTIECAKDSNQLDEDKDSIRNTIKTEMDLTKLLLSSPSFLNCAEELYDCNTNQPMCFQFNGLETGTVNSRLFLDCAHELMTRKSCQREFVDHSLLWTYMWGPKVSISIDQLVEELIDEIENLRSYNKTGDGVLPTDGLYTILGKDLRCKRRLVNGVWDLGWVSGHSMEDAEQVIVEVEKHVLSCLIEEVISDFKV